MPAVRVVGVSDTQICAVPVEGCGSRNGAALCLVVRGVLPALEGQITSLGTFQAMFVNIHQERLRKAPYLAQTTSLIPVEGCEPALCPAGLRCSSGG